MKLPLHKHSSNEAAPLRLAYGLYLAGATVRTTVVARLAESLVPLLEPELKALRPRLHALDAAIVRELLAGPVYCQISETQLARVLPLLAQRATVVDEGPPLRLLDVALKPRAQVLPMTPASRGLKVQLVLEHPDGTQQSLAVGRLIAGAQAFFVVEGSAYPVAANAPWLLSPWARQAALEVVAEQLASSAARDELVRSLSSAGIPEADLHKLAVRRTPPDCFSVTLQAPQQPAPPGTPLVVQAVLQAHYGGAAVVLQGSRGVGPALWAVGEPPEFIERDVVAEEQARRLMRRLGFRFDRQEGAFVARDEAALRALDPQSRRFPLDWQVEYAGALPQFHRDLQVRGQVQLLEQQNLLALDFNVHALDDAATARALIDMRGLLEWLHSGHAYLQLADGSFVAPSAAFRRKMRILEDLGAASARVLVSPLCVGLLRHMGDDGALATVDGATRAWLEEVGRGGSDAAVTPPEGLKAVLRDYQRRGLNWLLMLHRHRLTGILADDMGLGKTVQTLALLLKVAEQEGPAPSLVVAPTSVVTVWRDEAARFAPGMRVGLYHGPAPLRHSVALEACDLVVTSYGVLRRDAERLKTHMFRYVILDEAQSAKNASSHNAHAIRLLRSQRRLALTGTPIENSAEELWAVFDFLAPGFLGSLRQFRQRYGGPIARGDAAALALLRDRVQPLVLRRIKKEVAQELPAKVEAVARCELLPAQRALYEHVAGQLREAVVKKIEKVGLARAQLDILAALTRLRQICCDPSLLPAPPGTKVPGSAKLELFTELMREALASERTVIVYSQFVEMQRLLIGVIEQLGVKPLWLHGGTRHRDEVVRKFQDPAGPPVIVVSLRAGGTGLTLTRADTVLHYDPWWNPAVERQATDRAHRLGQRNQLLVYKLVCARTVEERVLEMAARKELLAEDLLAVDAGHRDKLMTQDQVLALLS